MKEANKKISNRFMNRSYKSKSSKKGLKKIQQKRVHKARKYWT